MKDQGNLQPIKDCSTSEEFPEISSGPIIPGLITTEGAPPGPITPSLITQTNDPITQVLDDIIPGLITPEGATPGPINPSIGPASQTPDPFQMACISETLPSTERLETTNPSHRPETDLDYSILDSHNPNTPASLNNIDSSETVESYQDSDDSSDNDESSENSDSSDGLETGMSLDSEPVQEYLQQLHELINMAQAYRFRNASRSRRSRTHLNVNAHLDDHSTDEEFSDDPDQEEEENDQTNYNSNGENPSGCPHTSRHTAAAEASSSSNSEHTMLEDDSRPHIYSCVDCFQSTFETERLRQMQGPASHQQLPATPPSSSPPSSPPPSSPPSSSSPSPPPAVDEHDGFPPLSIYRSQRASRSNALGGSIMPVDLNTDTRLRADQNTSSSSSFSSSPTPEQESSTEHLETSLEDTDSPINVERSGSSTQHIDSFVEHSPDVSAEPSTHELEPSPDSQAPVAVTSTSPQRLRTVPCLVWASMYCIHGANLVTDGRVSVTHGVPKYLDDEGGISLSAGRILVKDYRVAIYGGVVFLNTDLPEFTINSSPRKAIKRIVPAVLAGSSVSVCYNRTNPKVFRVRKLYTDGRYSLWRFYRRHDERQISS